MTQELRSTEIGAQRIIARKDQAEVNIASKLIDLKNIIRGIKGLVTQYHNQQLALVNITDSDQKQKITDKIETIVSQIANNFQTSYLPEIKKLQSLIANSQSHQKGKWQTELNTKIQRMDEVISNNPGLFPRQRRE